MKKENLVILKGKSTLISQCGTRIEPNKHYRCIEVSEGTRKEFLVYGIVFLESEFNELFLYLHDVIMDEMSEIGLLPNMKPLTKKAFIDGIDLHTYGKGQNKLFIGFFGSKVNTLIGFYPSFRGDTKKDFLDSAYRNYQDTLNGDMDSIDGETIQRGNSGIPICYGDIYFRKEYNPTNEKLEVLSK